MAWKTNKIAADLGSYVHYIRGIKKAGKSTLFRDLVLEQFDDESKGLLLSFGDEDGYKSLDRLQYEEVTEWDMSEEDYKEKIKDDFIDKIGEQYPDMPDEQIEERASEKAKAYLELNGVHRGFVQIVDDLVLNNSEYGIKMLCYDTIDKLIEVAERQVINLSMIETGKPCKSLNAALGGYGEGKKRLKKIILEQTNRLKKVGLYPFVLGHTKMKDKADELTGVEYSQLTSSLTSDLDGIFGDTAQIVMTISIDKQIADGKIIGTERMMHFRDNGLVDSGSRFTGMPEKLPLSAKNYIAAFKIGVKSSFLTPKSEEEIEKVRKQEVKKREEKAKAEANKTSTEKTDLPTLIEKILNTIKEKIAAGKTPQDVMEVLSKFNISDPHVITDTKVAKEILKAFN